VTRAAAAQVLSTYALKPVGAFLPNEFDVRHCGGIEGAVRAADVEAIVNGGADLRISGNSIGTFRRYSAYAVTCSQIYYDPALGPVVLAVYWSRSLVSKISVDIPPPPSRCSDLGGSSLRPSTETADTDPKKRSLAANRN